MLDCYVYLSPVVRKRVLSNRGLGNDCARGRELEMDESDQLLKVISSARHSVLY
jgi:hypothetical protein